MIFNKKGFTYLVQQVKTHLDNAGYENYIESENLANFKTLKEAREFIKKYKYSFYADDDFVNSIEIQKIAKKDYFEEDNYIDYFETVYLKKLKY